MPPSGELNLGWFQKIDSKLSCDCWPAENLLVLESESQIAAGTRWLSIQWLKLLRVVNWEGVLVEESLPEGVMHQAFEICG